MPYWKRLTPSIATPPVGGVHGVPPAPEPPIPPALPVSPPAPSPPAPPGSPPWPPTSTPEEPQAPANKASGPRASVTAAVVVAFLSDKRDFISVRTPSLFRGRS